MSRAISLSFRRSSHHRVSAVIDQPDALVSQQWCLRLAVAGTVVVSL